MHICPSFTQTTHGGPGYSQVGLQNFPSILYCRLSEFILKMKLVTKRCRAVLRSKAAFMSLPIPLCIVQDFVPFGGNHVLEQLLEQQNFFQLCATSPVVHLESIAKVNLSRQGYDRFSIRTTLIFIKI